MLESPGHVIASDMKQWDTLYQLLETDGEPDLERQSWELMVSLRHDSVPNTFV